MTNEQLVQHLESMTMKGAGADDPQARFGYDRARGEILNLLRTSQPAPQYYTNPDYRPLPTGPRSALVGSDVPAYLMQ